MAKAHLFRRLLVIAGSAVLSMGFVVGSVLAQSAPERSASCSPAVVPMGQANPPGSQSEPMAPIWCFNLAPQGAPTRISGANDWVDTFEGVTQMGAFNDGDLDYRVFDSVQNGGTAHTQHFTNNNHWMDDNAGGFLGGTMIRPNRSFRFENGKLVVEADVAAGISGYMASGGADVAWPEIDISTADSPIGHAVTDSLYAYGRFGGADTLGCRLHAGQKFTCSYEAARGGATGKDTFPCFEFSPARLVEISGFEGCGTTHFGGDPGFGAPGQYFRTCDSVAQSPDMLCRDRFRLELSQDGLVAYVNGQMYFQDTGWPARNQLPEAMANGSTPVYVYMSDWEDTPNQAAYRFHWQRFAVNPHNADGSIVGPSAAPSFCLGQAHDTCDMGPSMSPSNTAPAPTVAPPLVADTNPGPAQSAPSDTPAAVPDQNQAPPSDGQASADNSGALVGNANVQRMRDSNPAGTAEAFHFVARASGPTNHLNIYLDATNAASTIVLGMYDDSDGHPGHLLASGAINSTVAGSWNVADIDTVAVTQGTPYWIAVLGPAAGGGVVMRDVDSGGDVSQTSRDPGLQALPSTWAGAETYGSSPLSAYAAP